MPDNKFDLAEQLVSEGNFDTAIAVLQQIENSDTPRKLERTLINLRIKAYRERKIDNPSPPAWPPMEAKDNFTSVEGIPELSADTLDAATLVSCIRDKGCVIVRNVVPPAQIQQFKGMIDRSIKSRAEAIAAGNQRTGDRWYYRTPQARGISSGPDGPTNPDTGTISTAFCPPAMQHLIQYFKSAGMTQLLTEYFGERPTLSLKKCTLRKLPPQTHDADWHQDGRFMGTDLRTVNLWMALTDCGEGATAPGIDVIPNGQKEIYASGTYGAHFDWSVSPDVANAVAGNTCPVVRPRFAPGDVIFFDHYTLHRTAYENHHTDIRYAIESWFFAESFAPEKQVPVYI